jgi:hypothetical protein
MIRWESEEALLTKRKHLRFSIKDYIIDNDYGYQLKRNEVCHFAAY